MAHRLRRLRVLGCLEKLDAMASVRPVEKLVRVSTVAASLCSAFALSRKV